MDTSIFSDMKKCGAGIWFLLHILATNIKISEDRKHFKFVIDILSENMKCEKCKNHFQEYIKNNPLENETNYYKWTWELHNQVNLRNNKPYVNYDQSLEFYQNKEQGICKNCMVEESKTETSTLPEYIKKIDKKNVFKLVTRN
jgi:hypothetical protein